VLADLDQRAGCAGRDAGGGRAVPLRDLGTDDVERPAGPQEVGAAGVLAWDHHRDLRDQRCPPETIVETIFRESKPFPLRFA